jgi:cytochrome c
MKLLLGISAIMLFNAGAAFADDDLYRSKNCMACHRVDRNTLGPSFKSVAAKYENQQGVDVKLAQKIREGGVGVWGSVPMPAQPQVTEAESLTLARWILTLK